jgi:putative DNA primase/helicase
MDKEHIQSIKQDSIHLAGEILNDLFEKEKFLVYVKSEEVIYIYNKEEGVYEELSETIFDSIIYDFFVEAGITTCWKIGRINEIKRAIACSKQVAVGKEMDDYDNLINLNNGVLNLDTMSLAPHNHGYYFTTKIDVDYEADNKKCPEFVKFLQSTFNNNSEVIDGIMQVCGYILYPQNRMDPPKMFMFMGEGANGKSMLIDIMSLFFDPSNVSYLSLAVLSKQGSMRSSLLGSRLNISSEEKGANIDSEEIKKIISSEAVQIERKYKPNFAYKPKTKIILASNTTPYFNDTSHGIYRRLYMVDFPNRFIPQREWEIMTPEAQQECTARGMKVGKDKTWLLETLKKEKTAILNLFLTGLKKLRKNGWIIPETEHMQRVREEYFDSTDNVRTFLVSRYEAGGIEGLESPISITQILEEYREWYRENVSERPLNYSTSLLGRKIKAIFKIESVRLDVNGEKVRHYYLRRLGNVISLNE